MSRASFVRVGRVARTHGLNGEVSVVMTEDLPAEDLEGMTLWFVPPPEGLRSAVVESVRQGPKGPLFTLRDVTSASSAAVLRGLDVTLDARDLPEAFEDLTFDPIGLLVLDRSRGELGRVTDVIATGANDVWVVEGGRWGQVLVPVIDDVVLDIDEDAETVTVELLPGLVEEEPR